MIIRTETKEDYRKVYDLNKLAFENGEFEAQLVEKIRKSNQFIPELSIVAEAQDQIIGQILLSKANVVDGDTEHEVIVLAPIAVHPAYQKQGIGGQLITEGIKRCQAAGYPLIFLIGHPEYYPKFGFKPARSYGLDLKQYEVPDEVFMVYEAIEGALATVKGELRYPETF